MMTCTFFLMDKERSSIRDVARRMPTQGICSTVLSGKEQVAKLFKLVLHQKKRGLRVTSRERAYRRPPRLSRYYVPHNHSQACMRAAALHCAFYIFVQCSRNVGESRDFCKEINGNQQTTVCFSKHYQININALLASYIVLPKSVLCHIAC